ncbi:ABC transporter ATP-binding protein [Tumebacillus sp. DT12]|uniref:ABC transporter ATP-binding protein n=1 Tax=Tumebacillus lacus TaxID=2995335 RepID=A0ABT3X6W6_9BACL|nr:ABC transporter ATP-binding protein [Tumebacillus lacus]MCX7571345.1 ABC transporter ATP-binding protein [Tumebacillus lacus]
MKSNELTQAVRYIWQGHRTWVICTAVLSLMLGLTPAVHLWVAKELVNEVAALLNGGGDYSGAFQLLVVQFLVLLLASLLTKAQELLDKRTELHLDHDLQRAVMEKTTTVPLELYDRPDFQHAIERVHGGQAHRFLTPIKQSMDIVRQLTTLISFLFYLLSVHWTLALVSVVAAFPLLLVLARFGNKRFSLMMFQTPLAREARYLQHLMVKRESAKEVRLFQLRDFLLGVWSDRFRRNQEETYRLFKREKGTLVLTDALTAFFYVGAAGLIIWVARAATITIGDFVALGQAVQGTQSAINQIAGQIARLYESRLYLRDYFRFLDDSVYESRVDRGTKSFPAPLQAGISVERVSFRYPGSERPALQDVSLQIQPGERIAIVGDNGSGKTTLVKCLMGLYQVQTGCIRVDGVPMQDIAEEQLFHNITVIFQDFMRYDFTVRQNITIGQLEAAADKERLETVAANAGVESFVARFAQGYDTHLGRSFQEGEDLSGGQWQKIALARALFSEGQLLILDEPTAALDPKAEMEVFEHFDHLTRGKTAVFISHRMAAARMADRIIVMRDGQICEMGTHEQLIALEGEYKRMYTMQAQWYR